MWYFHNTYIGKNYQSSEVLSEILYSLRRSTFLKKIRISRAKWCQSDQITLNNYFKIMYHEVYRESEIWQKVGAMLYIYLSPPKYGGFVPPLPQDLTPLLVWSHSLFSRKFKKNERLLMTLAISPHLWLSSHGLPDQWLHKQRARRFCQHEHQMAEGGLD